MVLYKLEFEQLYVNLFLEIFFQNIINATVKSCVKEIAASYIACTIYKLIRKH